MALSHTSLHRVVDVDHDPLPDIVVSGDSSGDLCSGHDWLWRDLSTPRSTGGYYRGKRYGVGDKGPANPLCEPVSETLMVELLVEEGGRVSVQLVVVSQPWALSVWELEGLKMMGHARESRARKKQQGLRRRLHLDTSSSTSEIAAQIYPSPSEGGPSFSQPSDNTMKLASRESNSLDSAREEKTGGILGQLYDSVDTEPPVVYKPAFNAGSFRQRIADQIANFRITKKLWWRSKRSESASKPSQDKQSWKKIRVCFLRCLPGCKVTG